MNPFKDIQHYAKDIVQSCDYESITLMLKHMPYLVNMKAPYAIPLFHYCAYNDSGLGKSIGNKGFHLGVLKLFKAHGADFTLESNLGSFAARAVKYNHMEVIEWLYSEGGLAVDTVISENNDIGLHIAAEHGWLTAFDALLSSESMTSKALNQCNNYLGYEDETPLSTLMLKDKHHHIGDLEILAKKVVDLGGDPNPMVNPVSIWTGQSNIKVPLSFELAVSYSVRGGSGIDYDERAELIKKLSDKEKLADNGMNLEEFVQAFKNNQLETEGNRRF